MKFHRNNRCSTHWGQMWPEVIGIRRDWMCHRISKGGWKQTSSSIHGIHYLLVKHWYGNGNRIPFRMASSIKGRAFSHSGEWWIFNQALDSFWGHLQPAIQEHGQIFLGMALLLDIDRWDNTSFNMKVPSMLHLETIAFPKGNKLKNQPTDSAQDVGWWMVGMCRHPPYTKVLESQPDSPVLTESHYMIDSCRALTLISVKPRRDQVLF